jgi:hypothetical protein
VNIVELTFCLLDRKRSEEEVFKENETSRWKKVWNNIFKKIKRGKKKV